LRQRYDLCWTAKQSQEDHDMTTKALFVKLEAKPGKEDEVAKFLREVNHQATVDRLRNYKGEIRNWKGMRQLALVSGG
jgi:hypothetical protein